MISNTSDRWNRDSAQAFWSNGAAPQTMLRCHQSICFVAQPIIKTKRSHASMDMAKQDFHIERHEDRSEGKIRGCAAYRWLSLVVPGVNALPWQGSTKVSKNALGGFWSAQAQKVEQHGMNRDAGPVRAFGGKWGSRSQVGFRCRTRPEDSGLTSLKIPEVARCWLESDKYHIRG